jgi:hypothetical protein
MHEFVAEQHTVPGLQERSGKFINWPPRHWLKVVALVQTMSLSGTLLQRPPGDGGGGGGGLGTPLLVDAGPAAVEVVEAAAAVVVVVVVDVVKTGAGGKPEPQAGSEGKTQAFPQQTVPAAQKRGAVKGVWFKQTVY